MKDSFFSDCAQQQAWWPVDTPALLRSSPGCESQLTNSFIGFKTLIYNHFSSFELHDYSNCRGVNEYGFHWSITKCSFCRRDLKLHC